MCNRCWKTKDASFSNPDQENYQHWKQYKQQMAFWEKAVLISPRNQLGCKDMPLCKHKHKCRTEKPLGRKTTTWTFPFTCLVCLYTQHTPFCEHRFPCLWKWSKIKDTLTSPASDPSRSKVWRAFAIARMTPCMAGLSITYHGKQEKKHKQERGKQ